MAGEAHSSIKPSATSATTNAAGLSAFGRVASFRTQVSTTTFKIGLGPTQGELAAFGLDELNGLLSGHGFAGVAPVRACQGLRQSEAHDLSSNDGCGVHASRLTCRTDWRKL